jgi:hypothetical protein
MQIATEFELPYNSAEWLSDRRAMLAWWSNYLDATKSVAG